MRSIDAKRSEEAKVEITIMERVQYDRIVNYLRTGRFPSKNEKDFLRRKMKNLVVKDGLLFYSDKKAADLQVLKAKACEFLCV